MAIAASDSAPLNHDFNNKENSRNEVGKQCATSERYDRCHRFRVESCSQGMRCIAPHHCGSTKLKISHQTGRQKYCAYLAAIAQLQGGGDQADYERRE